MSVTGMDGFQNEWLDIAHKLSHAWQRRQPNIVLTQDVVQLQCIIFIRASGAGFESIVFRTNSNPIGRNPNLAQPDHHLAIRLERMIFYSILSRVWHIGPISNLFPPKNNF